LKFTAYHSGSTGNLYQVQSGAGNLIIDPGVPIAKIKAALNFRLSAVDAALVSHSHRDHCKGVPAVAAAGIDCYMLQDTAKSLTLNGHRSKLVTPLQQLRVAGFDVLPFPAQHDVPNVGYLIGDGTDKLLFLVDSYYCKYRFQGLTIIALAVNWSRLTMSMELHPVRQKRLFKSHLSLENAVHMLKANDLSAVREIHLIHLSGDNADPEYFRETIMRATGKPVYIGGEQCDK
jgi:phosphoribosyl 1,2-cyclic phosphodiesterase